MSRPPESPHIEYARACTALRSLCMATDQLAMVRAEMSITTGETSDAVVLADEAMLAMGKMTSIVQQLIVRLGRAASAPPHAGR